MAPRERNAPKPDSYSNRIALRLAELIATAGLSIDRAADRLDPLARKIPGYEEQGVKAQTLRSWLRGDRDVPPDLYPIISKAFGFTAVTEWLPKK